MDIDADIYESRYFRTQKSFLICIGLWPYHSLRRYISTFWLSLVVFLNGPQVMALLHSFGDAGKLMEHSLMLMVQFSLFMKSFTLVISSEQLKQLYDQMRTNWKLITDPVERDILTRYSERGRLIMIAYLSLQTPVFIGFAFGPLIPVLLNSLNKEREPLARIEILYGDFLLEDPDSHYAFRYCWEVMQIFSLLAICGPIDVMYSSSVEHCLGIYAIIKHRLHKLQRSVENESSGDQDESKKLMVGIIELHQIALESTGVVESSYSLCFLCLVCTHLVIIPLICVLALRNLDNPINLFRHCLFFSCALVHLFNIFLPGQKIINHCDSILKAATYNEWYTCSDQTKKLLQFFMIRSADPSYLTGGGLMLLNFENYFGIVKTAASYITVFASFQADS